MQKITVCLTTFNSEKTIRPCLDSVRWADEIIVVDSGSTDRTCEILTEYPVRVIEQPWLGYARQKQLSINASSHDWVFLLDSDEVLSKELQRTVLTLLKEPLNFVGFEFPRYEQLFWKMINPGTRHNYFMRMFDRRSGKMNSVPIHAAFIVDGPVKRVDAPLFHFSENSIATKVRKLNDWTDEISLSRFETGRCRHPWAMLFYPLFVFLRHFLFKRNFLNGWAGFISSVCMAFYAFMKDAKGLEHSRRASQNGCNLLTTTLENDGRQLPQPHIVAKNVIHAEPV